MSIAQDIPFTGWMNLIQQRTEQALEHFLPAESIAPERLHSAMRYTTLGGGKRVRPLLVHAAGQLVGADPAKLDVPACALEMIHVYSLVHDDMPCMDDDVLRRGKPTVHVAYDEATALLVGDALQTQAFSLLSRHDEHSLPPALALEMVRILAQAAGSRGMAGGQAIDLASVGKELSITELEFMHIHKTGALIRAAVLMGALCGGALDITTRDKLDHFGKLIGLLFQVVDDILDTQADTATLGKTAGKDAANHKPTYVSLLGLSQARELANDLRDQAFATLQSFGDRATRLQELTHFITARSF